MYLQDDSCARRGARFICASDKIFSLEQFEQTSQFFNRMDLALFKGRIYQIVSTISA